MIFREPPALATWLMDRLGYTRQNAPLAGDLLEEFRNGRSAGWYWRQTLAVIANGIPRKVVALRSYILAQSASYAAQFGVTLTLWGLHSPPEVHAGGWVKFAIWGLMQATYPLSIRPVMKRVVSQSRPNLTRMYWEAEGGSEIRSKVLALASYDSFMVGLGSYCLCALIFSRFSLTGLVGVETTWFILWILMPALFFVPAVAAPAAEVEEDDAPYVAGLVPSLTVTLSDGREILLQRDNLAESVFAAADLGLTAAVFRRGRSLELLRNAIWLGGSHRYGRPVNVTIPELSSMISKAARTKSVVEARFDRNERTSLWRRLNRAFRGDPA